MQDLMIITKKDNIILKNAVKKLSENGISATILPMDKVKIKDSWDEHKLGVLYIEDSVESLFSELMMIKILMATHPKDFIVVGGESEEEELSKYIPDEYVVDRFKKPLDIMGFLVSARSALGSVNLSAKKDGEGVSEKPLKTNKKKSILIIDDDASIVNLLRGWLKDEYTIQPANSGMHAKKWLMENNPDLIIVDYEMPLISGPMLIKQLREDERTKDIPFMFLTGKGDKNTVMEVMDLKPVGYFLKPVDKEKLMAAVHSFFSK